MKFYAIILIALTMFACSTPMEPKEEKVYYFQFCNETILFLASPKFIFDDGQIIYGDKIVESSTNVRVYAVTNTFRFKIEFMVRTNKCIIVMGDGMDWEAKYYSLEEEKTNLILINTRDYFYSYTLNTVDKMP